MIYTLSIISSTGYPFYFKEIHRIPKGVDLHLRFYDFCNLSHNINFVEGFELFAGLISALSEFSNLLGQKLELLKFNAMKNNDTKNDDDVSKPIENKVIKNPLLSVEIPPGSDAIVNVQNERFLCPTSIQAKINIIYKNIIESKLPLGMDQSISEEEEQLLIDIIDDKLAKEKVESVKKDLKIACDMLLNDYKQYGLEAIAITTFDYTPIETFDITKNNLLEFLRDMGRLPDVKTFNWKTDTAYIDENTQKILYIINSGVGITVKNVFMPYYYLLIAKPDSYLAEIPRKVYAILNSIIDR
jgi:hypothetical protein